MTMFIFNLKRGLFDFHIIGLPMGGFIILIGIIVLCSCIYSKKKDFIQPYYMYPSESGKGKWTGFLCVANVFFNNSIPWVVLIASNICYHYPYQPPVVAYVTSGYIVLNILVILLLLPHDIRTGRDKGLLTCISGRFLASLCCMYQIHYVMKPFTKKPDNGQGR